MTIFRNNLRKSKPRLVEFTLLQLLQHNVQLGAAVKFSLLSSHWFVYGVRQKFIIINLSQTVLHCRYFLELVKRAILNRRHILFVNERRYASKVVSDVAFSVGEAYISGRWVGGALTNFKKLWLMYYRTLKYRTDASLSRFQINLRNSLRGFVTLKALPAVVFFNSVRCSYWATSEAAALRIPSAGITDTDSVPSSILYPLPGNDDAFGSIFFLNKLVAKVTLISKIEKMLVSYNKFSLKLSVWAARIERSKRWLKARKNHKKKPFFRNKRTRR